MKASNLFKISAIALGLFIWTAACTTGDNASSAQEGQEDVINSNYGGVQIGAITYSFRSIREVEDVIQACIDAGLSSVELMGTGIEAYLGAPENPVPRRRFRPGGEEPPPLTEEQQAAIAQYQADLKAFRDDPATMTGYEELRKKFNDAGINIHIYKWTAGNTPEELDYSFQVAKTLGAIGITAEVGEDMCRDLGAAAERAGMLAIFHNHMQFAEEGFDIDYFLDMSPANRLNFDVGHYYGSTGKDPAEFIEKYHDKIASIHLKDKTGPDVEEVPNMNQVWGQGQVPIAKVLKLIQENNWDIYCDIELEYEIKPWSDPVREVKICREFARQILL